MPKIWVRACNKKCNKYSSLCNNLQHCIRILLLKLLAKYILNLKIIIIEYMFQTCFISIVYINCCSKYLNYTAEDQRVNTEQYRANNVLECIVLTAIFYLFLQKLIYKFVKHKKDLLRNAYTLFPILQYIESCFQSCFFSHFICNWENVVTYVSDVFIL